MYQGFFFTQGGQREHLRDDTRDLKGYGNLGENIMDRETGKYKDAIAGASSVLLNSEVSRRNSERVNQ